MTPLIAFLLGVATGVLAAMALDWATSNLMNMDNVPKDRRKGPAPGWVVWWRNVPVVVCIDERNAHGYAKAFGKDASIAPTWPL